MSTPNPSTDTDQPLHTPLHQWHVNNGGRMASFAGYDMPIRYPLGTIAEHVHTRTAAGLFDVSHMGVAEIHASPGGADGSGGLGGLGGYAEVAQALEQLVPCDVESLAPGRQRYTQVLNESGGTIDDIMISRWSESPESITIVSNAGRKAIVFAHIRELLPKSVELIVRPEIALVALQGPLAATVLQRLSDDTEAVEAIEAMKFMDVRHISIGGAIVGATRSGYTGEDGFELAINEADVVRIVELLVEQPEVEAVGLGARDTLRLEAGLCLYGNELDETTSPIQAGLTWSIQKRRRQSLGFLGSARIGHELANGVSKRLVGLAPVGKQPVREHMMLFADAESTSSIGHVTSGGFSPTLSKPIACGYIDAGFAADGGTIIFADVRGNRVPVVIATMPFVPHTYKR
jgi:aminomethyltransferase